MTASKYTLLEDTLNQLIHQTCWSVMVSGGLDNRVSLSFGEKVERIIPLDAPNLTDDQRRYSGAFELVIADCTWRLDSPDMIVTSWSDDDRAKREALVYLIGQKVEQWEITWPGLDLTLHFSNTLALRLFCDQTDPTDSSDNYALYAPAYLFNVGIRSELTVQPRPAA